MSWYWRYEGVTGEELAELPAELGGAERFPTQSDAESWVGECWHELADAGVAGVVLFEDDRRVYGPMSLAPPD